MKKYQKPSLEIVSTNTMNIICISETSNEITNTNNNADIIYGGRGSGSSRAPQRRDGSLWEAEW